MAGTGAKVLGPRGRRIWERSAAAAAAASVQGCGAGDGAGRVWIGHRAGPQAKTLLGSAPLAAAAAAGDGGHRGRARPGRPLRRRGASGAPPPSLHGRGQAQAPVVQGRADTAPARGPDSWHADDIRQDVRVLT